MRAVIAGAGAVGASIARELHAHGHEVVVVEARTAARPCARSMPAASSAERSKPTPATSSPEKPGDSPSTVRGSRSTRATP